MSEISFDLAAQFFAAAVLLVGLWLMGNHRLSGPALAAGAEVIWIAVFVPHGMWGGVFLSAILFAMQARNFVKWRGEGARW